MASVQAVNLKDKYGLNIESEVKIRLYQTHRKQQISYPSLATLCG